MTDKQIIDVSDCNYHNNGKCTNSEIGQCNCANVASCYYKEYKRKEQECEELKEEIKTKTYHWEQCTEEILKGTKQFVDRMEKAEKTLTEIKEIAKNGCYDDCGMPLDELSIILQKISEVLE